MSLYDINLRIIRGCLLKDLGLLAYQLKNVQKWVWTKNTEMEEDNKNGECLHAVKHRNAYFASTALAICTRVYCLLFKLPLLHRLVQIGIREKVCKCAQILTADCRHRARQEDRKSKSGKVLPLL